MTEKNKVVPIRRLVQIERRSGNRAYELRPPEGASKEERDFYLSVAWHAEMAFQTGLAEGRLQGIRAMLVGPMTFRELVLTRQIMTRHGWLDGWESGVFELSLQEARELYGELTAGGIDDDGFMPVGPNPTSLDGRRMCGWKLRVVGDEVPNS